MRKDDDNSPSLKLDAIDYKILGALVADGRMTTLEVADKVNLSATPCGRRIKRLEEAGIIEGYSANINYASLGLKICVMVSVRLSRHGAGSGRQFLEAIRERPEITECLLVTGNIDYLLRIWVKDVEALRDFIRDFLQSIPAVAETSTMMILDVSKSTGALDGR